MASNKNNTVFGGGATVNTFLFSNNATVRVHPLCLVTILDCYQRHAEKQTKTIGTIVGYVSEGNIIDVVDAFQVLHEEKDSEVLYAQDYHRKMFKLRQQVHTKEQVLGWFQVGEDTGVDDGTVQLLEFYKDGKGSMWNPSMNLPQPLFLQVDISMQAKSVDFKAYTTVNTTYNGAENYDLVQFREVPLDNSSFKQEKPLMDSILRARILEENTTPNKKTEVSRLDTFGHGINELHKLLLDLKQYTEDVLVGKVERPDENAGRELLNLLTINSFDNLRESGMRDAKMLQYLATLAKSQIVVGEKINHTVANQDN